MKLETSRLRNHFLDILKAAAILCILITHFHWTDQQRLRLFFPFWIDMAVPVFMVISGYVNFCSSKRSGINSLREAYAAERIRKKLLRYLIPFGFAYLAETALIFIFSDSLDKSSLLYEWIRGGTDREVIMCR